MSDLKLGAIETKFAEMIWTHTPIPSSQLAKLAEEGLGWKKSTTYTVLKRLCDRGLFINEKSIVRVLINKEEFYARQSTQFVEETFDGSLPAFVAAFGSRKKLDAKEIDELQAIIDKMRR